MAAQAIFDGVISNALQVFRLAASQVGVTIERLKKLEQELVAKLSQEVITGAQQKKVERFLKETGDTIDNHYEQLQLNFDFQGIGQYVAGEIHNDLTVALGAEALKLPSQSYFKSLNSDVMIMGAPSTAWWKGQSEDLKLKFAQQVRQGLSGAETNQQIISRIVGKAGEPGIMETARRNAAALVQTSVQAVANDARRNVFIANDDVIKGIKQVSTLDSHTSLICISYSGCEWDLEFKPIGMAKTRKPYNGGTPRHFNCRSLEIPITKTFEELGLKGVKEAAATERASELGPIDANTSFDDFLKRRGQKYQDEMLGAGRAELWRDGKLTLRDLVNAKGRPLTLDELRSKYTNVKPKTEKPVVVKTKADIGFFKQGYLDSLPKSVVQPYTNWKDLEANAVIGKQQFDKAMDNVAKKLGLRTDIKPKELLDDLVSNDEGFLFKAPLKGYKRALEKVTDDYEGDWNQVNDIVRGTISVKSLDDVATAIEAMRSEGIDFVARPKDRFLKPVPGGYRDILGLVKLPNGMNAEIQFHVKEMTAAKAIAHKYYEVQRTIEGRYEIKKPDVSWSKQDLIDHKNSFDSQVKIYEPAWSRTLNST